MDGIQVSLKKAYKSLDLKTTRQDDKEARSVVNPEEGSHRQSTLLTVLTGVKSSDRCTKSRRQCTTQQTEPAETNMGRYSTLKATWAASVPCSDREFALHAGDGAKHLATLERAGEAPSSHQLPRERDSGGQSACNTVRQAHSKGNRDYVCTTSERTAAGKARKEQGHLAKHCNRRPDALGTRLAPKVLMLGGKPDRNRTVSKTRKPFNNYNHFAVADHMGCESLGLDMPTDDASWEARGILRLGS